MKPNKFSLFTIRELEEIRQAFCFRPRQNYVATRLFEQLVAQIDILDAQAAGKVESTK